MTLTALKIEKLTHLTAHLRNGLRVLVICKDIPDLGDHTTDKIENVSCFGCLKTYDQYLEIQTEYDYDQISSTKH